MATRLSHRDLDACSCALRELYVEPSLRTFPDRLLSLVARLVSCCYISYNDFDLQRNQIFIRYHPYRPDAQKLVERFTAHYDTHPLSDYYRRPRPVLKKISDVASLRQFKETAIYQEYYRTINTRHQFICFFPRKDRLPEPGSFIGLALNRDARDFSERDRSILEFLSPHIVQAYRNAQLADTMAVKLEAVGEGLDTMRRALILAGKDGQIHWQSVLAREWLREFFPKEQTSERLPQTLVNRLTQMEKSSAAGQPVFSEFEVSVRQDFRLVVYCGKIRSGECVLALIRERAKLDGTAVQSLGLTPREAEILFWISEAKTRPEIGTILGISWRTIGKHMEHLFTKLGVENRLEAQRIGLELRRM